MRPFNLEEAKAGREVCDKEGRDVKIRCFDNKGNYPISANVYYDNGITIKTFNNKGMYVIKTFNNKGMYVIDGYSNYDLMMKD